MNLTVNVTQENIDLAEAQSKCRCPIALAVRDAHNSKQDAEWEPSEKQPKKPAFHSHVHVGEDHGNILIKIHKTHWHFDLPPMAQKFIVARDAGKRMKPFTFDIECEERAIKSALDTMRETTFAL